MSKYLDFANERIDIYLDPRLMPKVYGVTFIFGVGLIGSAMFVAAPQWVINAGIVLYVLSSPLWVAGIFDPRIVEGEDAAPNENLIDKYGNLSSGHPLKHIQVMMREMQGGRLRKGRS